MKNWLNYVEQLEAHMDEGGKVSERNVRNLIRAVRELSDRDSPTAAETLGILANTLTSKKEE